jgi:DNA-binding transcriptional LysR family regulator
VGAVLSIKLRGIAVQLNLDLSYRNIKYLTGSIAPMETSASTLRNRLLSRARLRHLHVFTEVAELLTVKRAAEAVGITQPSATQALADLERLLDTSLFLRHARGMSLTPAGALLLPLARRTLGLINDTATQAAALAQGSTEIVRIAAIPAAIVYLGEVLPEFVRANPSVLVQVVEADAARQATLITEGEVDCAFCRAPPVLAAGWSFAPLWPDRFAIVAGHAHPLARKQRISMADLAAATWIVTPTQIAAREAFDAFFARERVSAKTYGIVTASAQMMLSLLSKEDLLAFVPASIVRGALAAGVLAEVAWTKRFPFADIGILSMQPGQGSALDRFTEHVQKHVMTRRRVGRSA